MPRKEIKNFYCPSEEERKGNHWCKNNGFYVWAEETGHKHGKYKIFVQKGEKTAEMNEIYTEKTLWQGYYSLSKRIMDKYKHKINEGEEK